MKKHICYKCGLMAVWYYMPSSQENNNYYCDNCVSRGCSCNVIDYENTESFEEHLDNKGRRLPCIEFEYCKDGYDEE